jgi:hypothetical protein
MIDEKCRGRLGLGGFFDREKRAAGEGRLFDGRVCPTSG